MRVFFIRQIQQLDLTIWHKMMKGIMSSASSFIVIFSAIYRIQWRDIGLISNQNCQSLSKRWFEPTKHKSDFESRFQINWLQIFPIISWWISLKVSQITFYWSWVKLSYGSFIVPDCFTHLRNGFTQYFRKTLVSRPMAVSKQVNK
jgi:hypothetical protein